MRLVQKATGNTSESTLSSEDQELIRGLIETAREPLIQIDNLVTACTRNDPDAGAADRQAHLSISFTTWLKSQNSVGKLRKRILRAHRNIGTALTALISINQ